VYGHIRPECGNLRSKGKAFNAIQSDKFDKDDPEETFEDGIKYLAFPVTTHFFFFLFFVETQNESSQSHNDMSQSQHMAYAP